MKSCKRMTALVMTLIFVLTSVCSFTVFAADEISFTDVDEKGAYYEAITSLVEDGIINGYEDGTFKPENTITRAEFSKLLAMASAPTGTQFTATTTQFSDVANSESSSAWAIPYIAYAVGTGAINGYTDGTFKPTNPVTYGEAVKMIVCTLGYGPVVDTTLTPWYQGYINVASQIKLTKGAFSTGDSAAPRGMVAQLIYNMLDCSPLVQTGTDLTGKPIYSTGGFGGGSGSSSFGDSKDNTEGDEGILLGVFEYCLTGDSLTKSKVLIDDTEYNIGDLDREDLKELVGYAVSFKYTSGSKGELTKLSRATGVNKVITLEPWQIDDFGADYIEYYADEDAEADDELTTVKLDSDLYVVYNGVVVDPSDIDDDFILEYFDVENGSIKLLSNDGNEKTAEVAFVESYDTYFMNSSPVVNDGVYTIIDKHAAVTGLPNLAVDSEDVTSVKKLTSKTGNLTDSTMSGITSKSIVEIAVPYGTTEGTMIVVSSATVTGTVNQMTSDYEEIVIGSDDYEISPYFETLLENGIDVGFEVDDTGKFYLDYLGRIAYFEKTDSSNPYGLLVQYATGSGMDSGYEVKILSSSNSWLEYPLKDKVKINGTSMDDEQAIEYLKRSCPTYDEENYPTYLVQPVKYSTTTSGGKTVISDLECVDPDDASAGNIVPANIKNSVNTEKLPYANGGTLKYSSSGYAFSHDGSTQFNTNSSTIVFAVPADRTKTTQYKKSSGGFSNNTNYIVEPYDIESGKTTAKVVIRYLAEGQTGGVQVYPATPVYFVNAISGINNSEGQPVKLIKCFKAGSEEPTEVIVEDDAELLAKVDGIESGDVIKFATEGTETVNDKTYPIVVDVKTVYVDGALTTETGSVKDGNKNYIVKAAESDDEYYHVIVGTVYNVEEGSSILMIPYLADEEEFNPEMLLTRQLQSTTKFYKYNEKDSKFRISGEAEINKYIDYEDSDETGEIAKTNASQALIIVSNKKVTGVYVFGE